MIHQHNLIAGVSAAMLGVLSAQAHAECPVEDFERFPIGTIIDNDIPGVTFSVQDQNCGPIHMRVVSPTDGTSSGTKAIRIDSDCPDFSSSWLRMTFSEPRRRVRFSLGEGSTNFQIRAFTSATGSVRAIPDQTISAAAGVHRIVDLQSTTANIRRVEVENTISLFEAIDDLAFQFDDTPPEVEFTEPPFGACVCNSVTVRGTACDDDGAYGSDRLEFRSTNGTGAWTTVASYTSPVCSEGPLYNFNVSDPAITEGTYYLRSTVENACGASDTDIATVFVSKDFDLVPSAFRTPLDGALIGGEACFDGSVNDRCFSQYTVEFRPVGTSAWFPVDSSSPVYTRAVTNDPFALWDTRGLPDGDYEVRVTGTDACGNSTSIVRNFSLDNTPPTAILDSPNNCDFVSGIVAIKGTAFDDNLSRWLVEWYDAEGGFTASGQPGWVTINSGTGPVLSDYLAFWDTDEIPPCAYALRLRVIDQTQVGNANCEFSNRTTIKQIALNVCAGCGP